MYVNIIAPADLLKNDAGRFSGLKIRFLTLSTDSFTPEERQRSSLVRRCHGVGGQETAKAFVRYPRHRPQVCIKYTRFLAPKKHFLASESRSVGAT